MPIATIIYNENPVIAISLIVSACELGAKAELNMYVFIKPL